MSTTVKAAMFGLLKCSSSVVICFLHIRRFHRSNINPPQFSASRRALICEMASLMLLRSLTRAVLPAASKFQLVRVISISQHLFATERRYTKKHEWISVDGDIATVGISSFAQDALGDIVYAELPEVGAKLAAGDAVGAVESVKAASDVYSPISGTVTEKNAEVECNPGLINKSTYDKGWLYKLKINDPEELKALMDEEAYEAFKKQEVQATE